VTYIKTEYKSHVALFAVLQTSQPVDTCGEVLISWGSRTRGMDLGTLAFSTVACGRCHNPSWRNLYAVENTGQFMGISGSPSYSYISIVCQICNHGFQFNGHKETFSKLEAVAKRRQYGKGPYRGLDRREPPYQGMHGIRANPFPAAKYRTLSEVMTELSNVSEDFIARYIHRLTHLTGCYPSRQADVGGPVFDLEWVNAAEESYLMAHKTRRLKDWSVAGQLVGQTTVQIVASRIDSVLRPDSNLRSYLLAATHVLAASGGEALVLLDSVPIDRLWRLLLGIPISLTDIPPVEASPT
jgi:hypothetical protein